MEPGKEEDFLRLRPLSERMKLCESEMEANMILKELEVLMKKS